MTPSAKDDPKPAPAPRSSEGGREGGCGRFRGARQDSTAPQGPNQGRPHDRRTLLRGPRQHYRNTGGCSIGRFFILLCVYDSEGMATLSKLVLVSNASPQPDKN